MVTTQNSFCIRSEEGRSIHNVDVSNFFNHLPGRSDMTRLSTTVASGSTSCAASLMEALEVWQVSQTKSNLLLIDEDSMASNLLHRDEAMAKLVRNETITPLVHSARSIAKSSNSALLLVAGSSASFFGPADLVLCMDEFVPRDVTEQAKTIVDENVLLFSEQTRRQIAHWRPLNVFLSAAENVEFSPWKTRRLIECASLNDGKKIVARGLHSIQHGETSIDLAALPQLVSPAQTKAIASCLQQIGRLQGHVSLSALFSLLTDRAEDLHTDFAPAFLSDGRSDGFLAVPRPIDIIAAINRLRTARTVAST